METFSIPEEEHPKFKAAMHAAALAAVAAFPENLELVKTQLRQHDPIGILASFTSYGLMESAPSHAGAGRKVLKDILQHHAELLQAIVLTIPLNEWGPVPVTPDVMEVIFDTIPKLAEAFFLQRTLEAEKVTDDQQQAILSLQERIRMHTMGIRNWGYFTDVISISKDLYAAIDEPFSAHHGFTTGDLIEVMRATVSEYERRQGVRWSLLRKVFTGRNARQVLRLYFKHVDDLIGSADEMLASLPGLSLEGAKSVVLAHYDLRLLELSTFTPTDIAPTSGCSAGIVERVFRSVSMGPGSLAEAKTEYLFLGNPIWEAPGINLGDAYFLPMPQIAFSHIHRLMERLAAAADLKQGVEKARSEYLQMKLEATLRSALPGAQIVAGAKWRIGDQEFETDVLILIDRTVLAAEAKSNRFTPEGLRGAPARVKRHVQDMVLAPSVQSARLADLIARAQAGDPESVATVRSLHIDPDAVDTVIRLSVTLDDLSVLSAAEGELKAVGWVPEDHDLAPTILIADLVCVADILDKPLLFLHYLSERAHFQKMFNVVGDELDHLGLYLETGFNIGIPDKNILFATTGMSAPIDRYYVGRDNGVPLPKPRPKLSRYFSNIIDRLNERRSKGWTTAGMYLLSCASPTEQSRIVHSLDKLRIMVRKTFRDPQHVNSLQIQPPQKRKASVGFYLFPEQLRSEHKKTMEQLAAQTLDAGQADTIILFGRSTENWDAPYEAVLYVKKK